MIMLQRPFLLHPVREWLGDPQAGPLMVTGPSRVGKSAFLRQLSLDLPDVTWITLPASGEGGHLPLAGLVEELALACTHAKGHGSMEASLPLEARRYLLSMESGLRTPLPMRAGVEHALSRLFSAALDLLGQVVVVVLDTLGGVDDFSLEILTELSGADSPLQGRLRLAVACVDLQHLPNGPLWESLQDPLRPYHRLAVPHWRVGEIRAWLATHFGASFVQRETSLVKKLHRASGGLPGLLALLVADLRRRGVLHYTATGWRCVHRRVELKEEASVLRLRLMRQQVEALQACDERALALFALLQKCQRVGQTVLEELLAGGFPLENAARHPAVEALCESGVARMDTQSGVLHLCLAQDSWQDPGLLPLKAGEELALCRDLRSALRPVLPEHPFLQLHLLLWEAGLAEKHRLAMFQETEALLEHHADSMLVVQPTVLSANPELVPLCEALLRMDPPVTLSAKLRLILVLHHRRKGQDHAMETHFNALDPALLNSRDRQLYLYLGMEHPTTRSRADERFSATLLSQEEEHKLHFNRLFDRVCEYAFDEAAPLAQDLLQQTLSDELRFRTEFLAMVCSQSHTPVSKECLLHWQERYQQSRAILSMQARHDILDWMGSLSLNFRHNLHIPYKDEHLQVIRELGWSESASRKALSEANLCLLYDDEPQALELYNQQAKKLIHNPARNLQVWSLNHIQALLTCGRVDLAYSMYCRSLGTRRMNQETHEPGLGVERSLLYLLAGEGPKAFQVLASLPMEDLSASPHFGPHVAHMVLATSSWLKQSALIHRIEAVRDHPVLGPWDHLLWHWCAAGFRPEALPDFGVEGHRLIPWFYALPVCEIALASGHAGLAKEAAKSLATGLRHCEHQLVLASVAQLEGDAKERDHHVLEAITHSMHEGLPNKQRWVARLFPDFNLRTALEEWDFRGRQEWIKSLQPPQWHAWPPEALDAHGQWELTLDAALPGALSTLELLGTLGRESVTIDAPCNGAVRVQVRLLGPPCLSLPNGQDVPVPRASWRLLGYLLCKSEGRGDSSRRHRQQREVCGESEDPKALQLAYGQLLQRLKKHLEAHDSTRNWLQVNRHHVELAVHPLVAIDWKRFSHAVLQARSMKRAKEQDLAVAQAELALSQYQGPFMDGVEAPWVSAVRAAAERDFEWVAGLLLSHYLDHAPALAEGLRQRILQRAPYLAQVPHTKWGM